MDFSLTEEQKMLRETMMRFIGKECTKEVVRQLDEADEFPKEIFSKLADLGVLGLTVPEKYGGSGRDFPRPSSCWKFSLAGFQLWVGLLFRPYFTEVKSFQS
jgi:alkylation response protein AidB-like acyl-CoA dehydrogenase